MTNSTAPDWIAVDWGTTHLRAWAMRGPDPTAQASSDDGMARLDRAGFEPALLRLVTPWLGDAPVTAMLCGMAGSRQGWVEAPYAQVPTKPADLTPVPAPVQDPRLRVFVLPGLKQVSPPDVMRGEETQIAGFLTQNPNWDGVICLPGTHTKWAHVSAGEVVSFQTFLTGELFALLGQASVLRHSLDGDGWDDAAFAEAVGDTLTRPERLAALLFAIRASDLLQGTPAATARARLSGQLIGAELAAARPYWLGQQIAVIGNATTARPYLDALSAQGVPVSAADADTMVLSGLSHAHAELEASS
ncbi:MAG: 2-dehydro-3-deoxygalactonokinase [Marinibacterium sp.]|nr:2-dehydro-3-deoxygalactonokinase [Marinibacterium sp.]